MVLRRVNVRRGLGKFFLVMALLALVEWFLRLCLSALEALRLDVPYSLILVLRLFHRDLPPLIGLVSPACLGNGFSVYCAPLGIFALLLMVGAIVVALMINFTRKRRLDREGPDSDPTRESRETNLTAYGSLALAVVYAEVLVLFISRQAFLGTALHSIAAWVASPLLILVFAATGRYLRRESGSD